VQSGIIVHKQRIHHAFFDLWIYVAALIAFVGVKTVAGRGFQATAYSLAGLSSSWAGPVGFVFWRCWWCHIREASISMGWLSFLPFVMTEYGPADLQPSLQ
jgi:hypothetical protein